MNVRTVNGERERGLLPEERITSGKIRSERTAQPAVRKVRSRAVVRGWTQPGVSLSVMAWHGVRPPYLLD